MNGCDQGLVEASGIYFSTLMFEYTQQFRKLNLVKRTSDSIDTNSEQRLKNSNLPVFFLFMVLILFCRSTAQDARVIHVKYNKTKCDYCKMFFQEKNFGAEIHAISDSILVFDATECLAAYLIGRNIRDDQIKTIWSVDYNRPTALVDGRKAWYIRSDKILSPMSVNIAAFASNAAADSAIARIGGEKMDWTGVVKLVRERWFPELQKK